MGKVHKEGEPVQKGCEVCEVLNTKRKEKN